MLRKAIIVRKCAPCFVVSYQNALILNPFCVLICVSGCDQSVFVVVVVFYTFHAVQSFVPMRKVQREGSDDHGQICSNVYKFERFFFPVGVSCDVYSAFVYQHGMC